MINPATEIRKGLYSLLNGAVTYNAVTVPVYEGEGTVTPYQILIGADSYTDRKTKHSLFGRVTIPIEVVTEEAGTSAAKAVDTILNSVFALLLPNVNGTSLTVVDSKAQEFSVCIIPYTYEFTNFHEIEIGSRVNLEFDIIGKYVAKLLAK